jgi:2-dehydropantoate 2-reductase
MTSNSVPEPIVIVGSGAMACLFGARLAPQRPVQILASWPQGVAALRKDGIKETVGEGWRQHPVQVTTNPSEISPARFALVLVKAWQTRRAAEQLKTCLQPGGIALTLQNGLGNREILAEALGESRAALGVTTYGATLLGPGQVRPAGEGVVELAMVPALEDLKDWLQQAGFHVKEAKDLAGLVWGKLAVNAGINPITALVRATNKVIAENPDARQLMEQSVHEVMAVAQEMGILLPQNDPVAATLEVAQRTAENRSSMLQDLERGAPTEVEAICGAIVQHGQQVSVETPLNQTFWRLIKAAAASAGD